MKTPILLMFKNNRAWTEKCLEYLINNTPKDLYSLILINNGSNEKNSEHIERSFLENSTIIYEKYFDSIGVSSAYNKAYEKYVDGKSDYFIILHNDCLVSKGWLEKLLKHAAKIKEDDFFSFVFPRTNYATENTPSQLDEDIKDKFVKIKKNNKFRFTRRDIEENLEDLYGPHGFDKFCDDISKDFNENYKIVEEISSHCLLCDSKGFKDMGKLDVDFVKGFGQFKFINYKFLENDIFPIMALDSYVHHNGNTTTDCSGEDYESNFKKNEKLLKNKIKEYSDKKNDVIRFNTKFQSNDCSVLAVRSMGIGDVIMSLFSLKGLKKKNPLLNITYMSDPNFINFIKCFDCIDKVIPFPEKFNLKKDKKFWIKDDYKDKFDYILDWIGYPEFIDTRNVHRVDKFLNSLPIQGIEPIFPEFKNNYNFDLPFDNNDFICISPKGTCDIRSIPDDVVNSIIKKESEKNNIVIIGCNVDKFCGDKVLNLSGKTNVEEMFSIIEKSKYIYTPDTGTFHIAGILNIPTIAFFGSIDPCLRKGFYKNKMIISYKESLPCTPCNDVGCKDIPCMRYTLEEIGALVDKAWSL